MMKFAAASKEAAPLELGWLRMALPLYFNKEHIASEKNSSVKQFAKSAVSGWIDQPFEFLNHILEVTNKLLKSKLMKNMETFIKFQSQKKKLKEKGSWKAETVGPMLEKSGIYTIAKDIAAVMKFPIKKGK